MLTKQDTIKNILKGMSSEKRIEVSHSLLKIQPFAGHENVLLTDEQRAMMTIQVQDHLKLVFDAMKLDWRNDPNLKDTPMRVASMWINELRVGRYQSKPRMEAFPIQFGDKETFTEDGQSYKPGMIITKKVDIQSLCSHHLMPFFNQDSNAYGLVSYIPSDKLLGISKLQRLVHWYGARPQLQEQLTSQIFEEICETIGTNDVMVSLQNVTHTCESLRGVASNCGRTNTLIYGGAFKNADLRREIFLQSK